MNKVVKYYLRSLGAIGIVFIPCIITFGLKFDKIVPSQFSTSMTASGVWYVMLVLVANFAFTLCVLVLTERTHLLFKKNFFEYYCFGAIVFSCSLIITGSLFGVSDPLTFKTGFWPVVGIAFGVLCLRRISDLTLNDISVDWMMKKAEEAFLAGGKIIEKGIEVEVYVTPLHEYNLLGIYAREVKTRQYIHIGTRFGFDKEIFGGTWGAPTPSTEGDLNLLRFCASEKHIEKISAIVRKPLVIQLMETGGF